MHIEKKPILCRYFVAKKMSQKLIMLQTIDKESLYDVYQT